MDNGGLQLAVDSVPWVMSVVLIDDQGLQLPVDSISWVIAIVLMVKKNQKI